MNAIRVIFVDDEPRVLEGLKRMLRPKRNEWQMTFVGSAQAALEALERGTAAKSSSPTCACRA